MLPGGCVKIVFQAGVLQVWLDEAGIEFDHADAVSAACDNIAIKRSTEASSADQITGRGEELDSI
jgi:hypothetical protein